MAEIAVSDTVCFFFFQAEDGIRDVAVTGVQTCALPILLWILTCFTHLVSGGSSIGGSTRASSSRIVSGRAGSRCTLRTALTRFPGALLNCWPSHWSSCSHRVCPSERWNSEYTLSNPCT